MSTISSVVFGGSQTKPTITILGSSFGSAPAAAATPAGSGATGFDYGSALFISDLTQNFSAGLTNSVTNNSSGLTNLFYTDTSVTFQLGSAYSLFLNNFKQGDSIGVSVNGASYFTTVNYVPPLTTSTIGVARFFDTTNGTHFFTSDPGEVQQILNTRPDLTEELSGLNAIDPTSNSSNAAPVYRFFDSVYGTHFFTSSASEKSDVMASRPDLTYEGVGFYEHASQQAGDVAVYRYFDTQFGTHFYTADATENSAILATRPDLKPEGVAFYAPS